MKAIARIFDLLRDSQADGSVVFVTDRPAGIIPVLAYQFHAARWHAGENGAVLYDHHSNREIVLPELEGYCSTIRPLILATLEQQIGLGTDGGPWQEGGRQVGIAIEAAPGQEGKVKRLPEILADIGHPLSIGSGSAPCIYPQGVDKRLAFQRLNAMYNFSEGPLFFIADNDRDIPFGEEVERVGGTVCGVGNSSQPYADFVRQSGGILAEGVYEEGLLQILRKIFLRS
jgi:hydroxymethylpyrimidine pyrophosphatase-like HAD family hydrolase